MSDHDIRAAIVGLLERRGAGRTICPSDAARALGGDDGFRALMAPVRETAYAMVDRGDLEVTQSGRIVDPRTARGAIRLRLPEG